jgi:dienelactone hydrolase
VIGALLGKPAEPCKRVPIRSPRGAGALTSASGQAAKAREEVDAMMTLGRAGLGLAAVMVAAGAASAQDVAYEVGGEAFEGYLAAADDPRGLVVIIHDWDGLDDYERQRADMLAEMGYDAFAVDLFGAGNRPAAMEERAAATRAVLGDPQRLRDLMLAGLAEARDASAAEGVVVTGYCFGGTVALALARSGEAGDVAGWASFHGNFPGEAHGDWPEPVAPILIMHGGIDRNPSIDDLARFVEEAEAGGLDYVIEIYSGADHAFSVFGGDRYDERADRMSWASFGRFLEERLGAPEG